MLKNKITAVLVAAGLIIGSAAVAAPAMADSSGTMPSGCSMSPTTPSVNKSNSKVKYGGSGSCKAASAMDIRLVHDYDNLPDARVMHYTKYTSPSFSGSYEMCDNGGTTKYYSELAFYMANGSADIQRISGKATLSHC